MNEDIKEKINDTLTEYMNLYITDMHDDDTPVFVGLSGDHYLAKWFTDSMDTLVPVVKRVIKDTGYVIDISTTIDGNFFSGVLGYDRKEGKFVRILEYDTEGEGFFNKSPSESLSLLLYKMIIDINKGRTK